jgi:hypothetical protein
VLRTSLKHDFSLLLKKVVQAISIMETTAIATKCDYDRDFTGCVLGIGERNGYHDSDFYATVWDEEQGSVRTIEDGTTRFYAPSKYHRVDATEEVRAKARNWWATKVGPKQGSLVLMGQRLAVEVGCTVQVIKGRKIPQGTKGEVVWKGRDGYYRSYGLTLSLPARAFRVGLRLADGSRVFTSLENVSKTQVVLPTEAEIADWVKNNNPY